MNAYYDALEVQEHGKREEALFSALPMQIAHAQQWAQFYNGQLRAIDPQSINSRSTLAALPVTRKSDLHRLQQSSPPFGGMNATPVSRLARIFVSPGPIYDPEGKRSDFWRTARCLYAAGFRTGDIVQNCFSYHFTPAGSMFETGLHALGCAVVPAGVGQTETQVAVMLALGVTGYVGTPSFLKLILDKSAELNSPLPALKKALVSGEAFLQSQRETFAAYGIAAFQVYGTADLGMIAYESSAREGLIVDEGIIVEIVRPGTGDPVPEGEVGEVVVTTFNRDYPLIRFATGDLSAVLNGTSPCGRTNMRIKGWMGRADQTTKVRGMFVHPHQVALVVRQFPEINRARLVVDNPGGLDRLRLLCDLKPASDGGLSAQIESAIREITRLRGEVEIVLPGALPNDGKVIEDMRKQE